MFFVRCPETDAAALTAQYDIGGYLLFVRDFDGQTKESVANTIAAYQNAAKTPMLIARMRKAAQSCASAPTRICMTRNSSHRRRCTARAALTASRATLPRRMRCCAI